MYVDTHCHIFNEDYNDIEEVIKKINNNKIIVSGTNEKTNKEVINLIDNYKNVYGTLGIHPSDVLNYKEKDLIWIEKNLSNSKIVGIGEIGLDYYWDKENVLKQINLFERQLSLAIKYNKVAVVHSRDSMEDIYKILSKNKYKNLKTVIHCFTGNLDMAKKLTKKGIMLGIGGIITFRNNSLIEVVKEIDLKHILLETDSPYLTPHPNRGKKNNPNNILYIADKIAEIKGMDREEVIKITTSNAFRQFDLTRNL